MEHPVHFTAHCLVKYELWVKCETCCSLKHGNNYDEVTHNLGDSNSIPSLQHFFPSQILTLLASQQIMIQQVLKLILQANCDWSSRELIS